MQKKKKGGFFLLSSKKNNLKTKVLCALSCPRSLILKTINMAGCKIGIIILNYFFFLSFTSNEGGFTYFRFLQEAVHRLCDVSSMHSVVVRVALVVVGFHQSWRAEGETMGGEGGGGND